MRVSLLLLLVVFGAIGQKKTRSQLEIDKKRNEAKLKETQQILNETKSEKKTSIKQLTAIQEQLNSKSQQIEILSDDIEILNAEISEIQKASSQLEKELLTLKKEYGEMLYEASKQSQQLNKLGFLFAAASFNELAMRFSYLRQFTQTRKIQLKQIQQVRILLAERQAEASSKRSGQQQFLKKKVVETENLSKIELEKQAIVKDLSTKETELKSEVAERLKSINKLEGAIANLVNREVKRKTKLIEDRAEIRKKDPENKTKISVLDAALDEDFKLETAFSSLKNRLPWPAKAGYVSERFGVHAHPVLKGVKVRNDGVDIHTPANATIQVVYDGIVRDIADIQGLGKVVAIQHGEYFTVYAKMNDTFVSVNQKVKRNQTIGSVANELNFQIWHNTTKLNPENWLKNK